MQLNLSLCFLIPLLVVTVIQFSKVLTLSRSKNYTRPSECRSHIHKDIHRDTNKQCVHADENYLSFFPNFHENVPDLYTKTERGKQHLGSGWWVYLYPHQHRSSPDFTTPRYCLHNHMETSEGQSIQVSYRIETQYINVIFRQVKHHVS